MGYVKGGFTYVMGPQNIREFNLNSACTVKAFMPVKLNGAGDIVESLGTDTILAGFIQHDAANSVPSGKCLVSAPLSGTIYAGTGDSTVVASKASSGLTLAKLKSGNSWYLTAAASTVTGSFIVIPRPDGSTLDSTDSSVWVQVIGASMDPFDLTTVNPTI